MKETDEFEELGPDEEKSKSQRKREFQDLQALARKLMSLSETDRNKFNFPEKLELALEETKRIKSHQAIRRHERRIAKLLNDTDTDEYENYFKAVESVHQTNTREFHEMEKWRERLLEDTQQALTEFIDQHPQVDIQALRQLIRNTQKEKKQGKPGRYFRELFRFIRECFQYQDANT